MNSPIEYSNNIGNFNSWSINPDTAFNDLKNEIEWEQRDAPRKECFLSTKLDSYTYGSGNGIRTYYPKPYSFHAKNWLNVAEHFASCKFEACFLNYYEGPKDHLGWHADDSDVIDVNRPIVVISLGSKREIWFKENGTKGIEAIEKLSLDPFSVLVMKAGMQQTHQHRIPKHGANCGERISLTFRGLCS
jgi:alkylated DNA repair dioxygenase AlkB